MIIGLTGQNGAGKSTVAEFLKQLGYHYESLSDEIRSYLRKNGLSTCVENLIQTGNELREEYGPDIWARKVINKLSPDRNFIVDSLRNPHEIQAFKKSGLPFVLLHITAPDENRYLRLRSRTGRDIPESFEHFLQWEIDDPQTPYLDEIKDLADITIDNEGSIEDLHNSLRIKLKHILSTKFYRPDWDEYFMLIARTVALRSNCIKRKIGAVTVKDKRLLTTGYNGTPRGIENCFEGGCERCTNLATSGTKLDECRCSHGEENAITQAAYHGVSLKDATIYVTYTPCMMCSKMIINAGITEVVTSFNYPFGEAAQKLLHEAEITIRKITLDPAAEDSPKGLF